MTRSARSLSRPWHMTRTAISVRSTFTRLQSFANVQAREFARHPDCSYRSESLFRLPSKSLRVRWLFHRFRSGPQSVSLTPSQDSGNPLGSRGFYFRAYLSSLPPRAADILTVRFGQLTVEGLSPSKIRSLVGCSHSKADVRGKARPALNVRFEPQNLTSYSGLILFQHFFSLIGIKERLWGCFRHLKAERVNLFRTIIL